MKERIKEIISKIDRKLLEESDYFYIQNGAPFLLETPEKALNIFYQITGFETSNAILILDLKNKKHTILTDGRYIEAARKYFNEQKNFDVELLEKDKIKVILKDKNILIVEDISSLSLYENLLEFTRNIQLLNFDNFINLPNSRSLTEFKVESSEDTKQKIKKIFGRLNEKIENIYIPNLYTASWLLNIRSQDEPSCQVNNKILINRNNSFRILKDREDLGGVQNLKISIDKTQTTLADFNILRANKNEVSFIDFSESLFIIQSIKTKEEIENIKIAHKLHGIAFRKLIKFIRRSSKLNIKINEIDISNKMKEFCINSKKYLFNSFKTIVGIEENSSIVHYNTGSFNKEIHKNSVILIDAGGQYKYGTTDVTRMILLGLCSDDFKFHYNLVLKAHISLAMTKFYKNTKTNILDFIARKEILKYNLDYNHGTGHGVGYCLNVHEFPSISKNANCILEAGNVVSIEPGIYIEGKYGIRIENLYLVKECKDNKNLLEFENLTKIPIDLSILQKDLFSKEEIQRLKDLNCK